MIRAIVLGAAAGGGFPQWNSNAPACRRARAGDPAALPRTQASLAVSGDDQRWIIVNASPDLREQMFRTPALHPKIGLRSTPVAGVILTSGEVDAVAGLLNMREREPFTVFATSQTHAVLGANPIFDVLAADVVTRRVVALDEVFPLPGDISCEMFAVPGKVPLFLEDSAAASDGDVVGVMIRQASSTICYVPGCAAMDGALADRLRGADLVMFDGTLWVDDEMIRAGLGPKTGRRMGHMSVSGPDGVMAALAGLQIRRKVLVHINNSNPILLDDSPERAAVAAAGWEVGYDGMEIRL